MNRLVVGTIVSGALRQNGRKNNHRKVFQNQFYTYESDFFLNQGCVQTESKAKFHLKFMRPVAFGSFCYYLPLSLLFHPCTFMQQTHELHREMLSLIC